MNDYFLKASLRCSVLLFFLYGALACESATFKASSPRPSSQEAAKQESEAQPEEPQPESTTMGEGELNNETGEEGPLAEAPLPDNQVARTLRMTCKQGDDETHVIKHPRDKDVALTVTGEICPTRPGETLTVLFMIDTSGSMSVGSANQYGVLVHEANDPTKSNSCGRFKAVERVIKKLRGLIKADHQQIEIQVLQFNQLSFTLPALMLDHDEPNRKLPFLADQICTGTGGTYFVQAFGAAQQILAQSEEGPKVIYFISDGVASDIERRDAVEAGKILRAAFNGLPIFSVLLGSGPDVNKEIMTEIAGKSQLVKRATNASDLVTKIDAFEIAQFKKNQMILKIAELGLNPPIVSISGSGDQKKWTSQRFVIPTAAMGDKPRTNNTLTFDARDDSGYEFSQQAKVKFVIAEDPQ